MKTTSILLNLLRFWLVPALGSFTALAQGTLITYQGRLAAGGSPATGLYDFTFQVYDAVTGGNPVGLSFATNAIAVSNGLFTANLDFGAGIFTGPPRWLQMTVKSNGVADSPSALSPRQELTAAPYAITSGNLTGTLPASQLSGTLPSALLSGNYSQALTFNSSGNSFTGNGAGLSSLNANTLSTGTVPDGRLASNVARTNQVWLLGGNAGTTPGAQFFGTTDNKALEMKVNGTRALRLEPITNDANHAGLVNLLGGGPANTIAPGVSGSVIVGGGAVNLLGSAVSNSVAADLSFLGGGGNNVIGANAYYSFLGGGLGNSIGAWAYRATVGGGEWNTIPANGVYATIPGGYNNFAVSYAFAAGNRAKANHTGAFVWADSQYGDFASTTTNQFNVRAGGGVRFETDRAGLTVDGHPLGATINGAFTLGTSGNQPLVFSVNGAPALRLEPTTGGPNIIGGFRGNSVSPGVTSATIAGGGQSGGTNRVTANGGTVSGGLNNAVTLWNGVVAGGVNNTASENATTVSGGSENQAAGDHGTVGGGQHNTGGYYATVPGGYFNSAVGPYSFAAGNRANANHSGAFVWADSQNADFASTGPDQFCIRANGGLRLASSSTPNLGDASHLIIGPAGNTNSSLSLGYATYNGISASGVIQARENGTPTVLQINPFGGQVFIGAPIVSWSSSLNNSLTSDQGGAIELGNSFASSATPYIDFHYGVNGPQDFNVRLINDGTNRLTCTGNFRALTLTPTSDRNDKEHFESVNPEEILEKVMALPITEWNFKKEPGVKHVGPMAQDFQSAFAVGADDKHIATVDADGVALAAIQGLNQKLTEQLKQKETEITELQRRLERLERLVANRSSN